MDKRTCTIDGCNKPARTKSAELCKMHYHRQYRNGSAGETAERKRKQRNPSCSIEECTKPDKESGLCAMHGIRLRRHGSPMVVIEPKDRAMPTGPNHHMWAGLDVGYGGAHERVRALHGPASKHRCIECSGPASHWSYNHDDPAPSQEQVRGGYVVAYSQSPEHYSPRCVPCHKRFDLNRADSVMG